MGDHLRKEVVGTVIRIHEQLDLLGRVLVGVHPGAQWELGKPLSDEPPQISGSRYAPWSPDVLVPSGHGNGTQPVRSCPPCEEQAVVQGVLTGEKRDDPGEIRILTEVRCQVLETLLLAGSHGAVGEQYEPLVSEKGANRPIELDPHIDRRFPGQINSRRA